MRDDPFAPFEDFLRYLDSHDGRLERRRAGYAETEFDLAMTVPTFIGTKAILTVGDLRALVEAGRRLRALEAEKTP